MERKHVSVATTMSAEASMSPSGGKSIGASTAAEHARRSPRPPEGKAFQARRTIDILAYFNDVRAEATVQQITRHFGWPQSSTSELMAVLSEIGVLYKDPRFRLYRPTARAAWLGLSAQPAIVRSGRLQMAMEALARGTGYSAAVIGKVGLEAQIFAWRRGSGASSIELGTSMRIPLHESAAGWLLLSTLGSAVWPRALHRLRSEAPQHRRFAPESIAHKVEACASRRTAWGPAGFGSAATLCAALVPDTAKGEPLVLAAMLPLAVRPSLSLMARVREVLQHESLPVLDEAGRT